MAQLQWNNVQGNFDVNTGRGTNLLVDSFDPLSSALKAMEKRQQTELSVEGIKEGLQYTDPELFQKALESGVFEITPENADFFKSHTSDLLAQQLAKLQNVKTQGEIAAQPLELESKRLSNINAGLTIDSNRQALTEQMDAWNQKLDRRAIEPEAMGRIAQIQQLATEGNVDGALRLIRDPENVKFLLRGGFDQAKIDQLANGLYTSAQAARGEVTSQRDFAHQEGTRPLREKEDIKTAERTALAGDRTQEAEDRKYRDLQVTNKEADTVTKELPIIMGSESSIQDMQARIQNNPDYTPNEKTLMLEALEKAAPAVANTTREDFLANLFADKGGPTGPRTQTTYETGASPQTRAAADSILGFTDKYEGGGEYDTLFSHAQKPGGPFEGVDVTKATIGQLNKFAREQYGPWVNAQIGRTATPMGRFQIVNSTLQNAAQALGLSPDTVFDDKTQNQIFEYLVNQRIGGPKTMAGKIAGLRQEWEGFKNVSDEQLANAVTKWENGDRGGLSNVLTGEGSPTDRPIVKAIDETSGPAAVSALDEFINKPIEVPLTFQENDIVFKQVDSVARDGERLANELKVDDVFGSESNTLLKEIMNPANRKLAADVIADMVKTYPKIDEGNMITTIDNLAKEYGQSPDVIAAFVKAAPKENFWLWDGLGFQDPIGIDEGKVRGLLNGYFPPTIKDPVKRMQFATEKLESTQAKNTSATNIEAFTARVKKAADEYTNAANQKQDNPKIDDKRALRKLKFAEEALKNELARINKDPNSRINAASSNPGR